MSDTPTSRYATVAEALGGGDLPPLTREQGIYMAVRIAEHFCPAQRTYWMRRWARDGRRVWVSTKPTQAENHSKGVGRLVHDMSHEVFEVIYPNRKPHDPLHAWYEKLVAAWVFERLPRWTKPPAPVVKPTRAQKHMAEYRELMYRAAKWRARAMRAANALRKLKAKQTRLERALMADAKTLEDAARITVTMAAQ